MAIDIILQANTKATLRTFGVTYNLLVDEETEEDGIIKVPREGLEWSWWPNFPFGVAGLLRIHGAFFDSDKIDNPVDQDQHSRSKIMRFFKNNGTFGTFQGIRYYEIDGVKATVPEEVEAYIVANGFTLHGFLGPSYY